MRQSPSARDRRCQGAPAAGGWLECSGRVLVTSGWQRCVPAGVVRRKKKSGGHVRGNPHKRFFGKSAVGRNRRWGGHSERGGPPRRARRARSGRPPDLLWPAPGAYARARAKRRGRARPGAAAKNRPARSHRVCRLTYDCSPRARGLSAGVGGHVSACPVRGRAVHMVAGAAPLLRWARRAAVRDGHSRRARSSQTRCGPGKDWSLPECLHCEHAEQ